MKDYKDRAYMSLERPKEESLMSALLAALGLVTFIVVTFVVLLMISNG